MAQRWGGPRSGSALGAAALQLAGASKGRGAVGFIGCGWARAPAGRAEPPPRGARDAERRDVNAQGAERGKNRVEWWEPDAYGGAATARHCRRCAAPGYGA
eukprot:TRINITY_DN10657_c0_g1_i1.p4 TRINITY_DN10657_c0_g1~~TRINITY_DN10657_c0_g1_i1.p4  ORF type:complete len:101 (-),score=2.91 TRINITY_DN10657_c0_g1_i1:346-648(-)